MMQYPVYNEQFILDSVEIIPISVCNVLYFVHFKLYTVQGQVSTGHCLILQHPMFSIMGSVNSAAFLFSVFVVHCTVFSVQFMLLTLHCTLCNVLFTLNQHHFGLYQMILTQTYTLYREKSNLFVHWSMFSLH